MSMSSSTSFPAALRPWRDFFSPSALSLPISLSELTTRLSSNIRHFLPNYAVLSLAVLLLSLFSRPLPLVLALLLFAAWHFLYLSPRDEPLAVLGLQIDDRAVLAALSLATLLTLTLTHVWTNVFVAALVSAGLACLHAAIRFPADAEYEESSPYGALLSHGVDAGDSPRGAYSHV